MFRKIQSAKIFFNLLVNSKNVPLKMHDDDIMHECIFSSTLCVQKSSIR